MSPPPNAALCPLIWCAVEARRDWRRKNSRGIVLSNKRVHRQVRARRHLVGRLCRLAGRVAFSLAEMSSSCLRRRLKPERLRKHQREQAARAIPELGLQLAWPEVEQPRRRAQA